MLHAAHILCLAPPASAAGDQAVRLACRMGATLHVMPEAAFGGGGAEGEAPEAPTECPSETETNQVSTRIVDPGSSPVATVLQYVADEDIDLVVADTPSDRGPVPPLAVEGIGTLVRRLDCPVFVVEQRGDPDAIRRILVPTDLSEPALQAFRHAVELAHVYGAAIDVLHVIDSLPYVALTPTDRLSLGATPLSEHRGRRRLRAFLREGEAADVAIRPQLAYGDAAEQIVHAAGQSDVDLMVLSAHGRGGHPDMPLGTVGKRVLGRVTCPLFLLRSAEASLLGPPANSVSNGTD